MSYLVDENGKTFANFVYFELDTFHLFVTKSHWAKLLISSYIQRLTENTINVGTINVVLK